MNNPYGNYGNNMYGNMNTGFNQGLNQNTQNLQSNSFRNVFGVLGNNFFNFYLLIFYRWITKFITHVHISD